MTKLNGIDRGGWFWLAVRADFVLAVLLTVIVPLALLAWATKEKRHVSRMLAYWRVSSLLAITVYLMIADVPIAFLTGVLARCLIPLALWFGDPLDKNRCEIGTGALDKTFAAWRKIATVYCIVGVLVTLPFAWVAVSGNITPSARVWLGPPKEFAVLFHSGSNVATLGNAAIAAWYLYAVYLLFWLIDVLKAKQQKPEPRNRKKLKKN